MKHIARSSIKIEETWSIDELYLSDEAIEEDILRLNQLMTEITFLQGSLVCSVNSFQKVFKLREQIKRISENLYAYSRMKKDEDNSISKYHMLYERCTTIAGQVEGCLCFIESELMNTDVKCLQEILKDPALVDYQLFVNVS